MLCTTQPNRNQETSNSRLQLVKEQKHGETTSLRYRLAAGEKNPKTEVGASTIENLLSKSFKLCPHHKCPERNLKLVVH